MTTALHTQHGAFLSELRSLGFTTVHRPTAGGDRGHAARLDLGTRRVIALLPTAQDPGVVLDFQFANGSLSADWDVPAGCFSDVVRDRLSGVEVARMHDQDCVCVHPDAR